MNHLQYFHFTFYMLHFGTQCLSWAWHAHGDEGQVTVTFLQPFFTCHLINPIQSLVKKVKKV